MGNTTSIDNDLHEESNDKYFEIFSFIWLDENISNTRNAEEKLRCIINHLKKFKNVKQCQQYIEQRSQNERVILIVSDQFGLEIIPLIHHLRQLISIYVYCTDTRSNNEWTCKFTKIKGIVVGYDELVSKIQANYIIEKKIEEPLSISNVKNNEFLFFQVLIDYLLRMKLKQSDNDELINRLKHEYKGNPTELNHISEFQMKYSADKVFWWYTHQSFFSKTLNAVLHTQYIPMMFLFCTYISDIYDQLERYQSKRILKSYRSQLISKNELENLRQCLGQLISINSFFFTGNNIKYQVALLFSDVANNLEKILFEIIADPNIVTRKPFADIGRHTDESQVLFMIGSIFRLESMKCNHDRIWIIQMTLCGDDDLKEQFGNEKIDLTEIYFQHFLEEFSLNDPLYKDLAELGLQKDDYEKIGQWQEKQLTISNSNTNETNSSIANETIFPIKIGIQANHYLNPQWNGNYTYFNNINDKQYYWTTPIDRGSKPYYCPIGWKRLSINVANDAKEYDKRWGDWPIAYHGTLIENVLNILASGLRVSRNGCFYDDGIPRVCLSPSIEYCAHSRFAQPWNEIDKNGRTTWYQLVFQCRVNPNSIGCIASETVLPVEAQSIVRIDPNFKNSELEWIILGKNNDVEFLKDDIICYGIMIRASNVNPKYLSSSAWWKYSYGADVYNKEFD
ncbi:unnamed protein product [Adineta steineri]|uniref:Uncharacterized protein n=1 Tax=Adineta steineri TaxID=433720 RepID=A0A814KYP0_9BILA|nr:unnamed protein product [Adineta steineri]CAF1125353.1 unnamed protein product [Adineta steineri]